MCVRELQAEREREKEGIRLKDTIILFLKKEI